MIPSRKLSKSMLSAALLALGMTGFIACSDDDDDPTGPDDNMGRIRIELTDAPFPYSMVDSAVVTIDSVSIHYTSSSSNVAWMTVDDNRLEINLLGLQNGTTERLADMEVPTGRIDMIRLHVSEASIALTDDRVFDLGIPADVSDGIEASPSDEIEIEEDSRTDLLVDFDVSNSFRPIPGLPGEVGDILAFDFEPTLYVADLTNTGSISGTVFSTMGTETQADDQRLEHASVSVFSGSTEVASSATIANGSFKIMGLEGGEYTVVGTAVGYLDEDATVDVDSGDETDDVEIRLDPIGG